MVGVYALSLIYGLITEKEIEDLEGKDYLEEVLLRKAEMLNEKA